MLFLSPQILILFLKMLELAHYDGILLTGSHIAAFVLARLFGCINWQDIEGNDGNLE